MIHLVELEPVDPATGETVVLRYATEAFVTEPNDDPANETFEARVKDPGNFERFMFGSLRTRGESEVGGGEIVLLNPDGDLDFMLDLAFDGRSFRVLGLADPAAPWASRTVIFSGTMEQATFPPAMVEIRIRDSLALLRETIQTERFAGTTTDGSKPGAEGTADLKDVLVPVLYGSARAITPVLADAFNYVYRVAIRLSAVTAVRDMGVLLTPTQDYPTVVALKAATIPEGRYGTCLAEGLVRTGSRPTNLTVDAQEGATPADRSAARIVQRMVQGKAPLTAETFDALFAANPAECGVWTGTNAVTTLALAMAVLNSIGGYLTADRFGSLQVGRLALPEGTGEVVIDENIILDRGEALSRQASNDDGEAVPARSVSVRWGRSYTVFTEQDLKDVAATEEFRSFAVQEWRQVVRESEANKTLYPSGPELVFDTCLTNEADAIAEAERLLAIYGARRDFFSIGVASEEITDLDLGDVATLAVDRFGMGNGVPVRVLGLIPTLATNVTELEVWR